jgi:hypothetical protein
MQRITKTQGHLINMTGDDLLVFNHRKEHPTFYKAHIKPMKAGGMTYCNFLYIEKECYNIFQRDQTLDLSRWSEDFDLAHDDSLFIVENHVREIACRDDFISPFHMKMINGVLEVYNFIY